MTSEWDGKLCIQMSLLRKWKWVGGGGDPDELEKLDGITGGGQALVHRACTHLFISSSCLCLPSLDFNR